MIWPLDSNPLPDAMRRVALLARCLPIVFQNPSNQWHQPLQHRSLAPSLLSLRRLGVGQCLPHHPAVNA
jgi:hypothetical protein